jgi:high-affinity iron transporter
MFITMLIAFREVIEAALIVATILGILQKLHQVQSTKIVWVATFAAGFVSIFLLLAGSILGLKVQEVYEVHEDIIEGILLLISSIFITWAVFFLHRYFGKYKTTLLQSIRTTIEREQKKGLFILVFTAVLREGIEIVMFLATMYFSSTPIQIVTGFFLGLIGALFVSFSIFRATLRLPVIHAFRATSLLLIFFAAGQLARGIQILTTLGIFPRFGSLSIVCIPRTSTYIGSLIQMIFGLSRSMDVLSFTMYVLYVGCMIWWVFGRERLAVSKIQG